MPSILDRITIQSPCTVPWDTMASVDPTGADRIRHCGECRLNVFNVAAMSRAEAEHVITTRLAAGQRVCAQLIRRPDGTVITADCIAARNRIRARARRVRVAAAALLAMVLPGLSGGCGPDSGDGSTGVGGGGAAAPHTLPDPEDTRPLRGDICLPGEVSSGVVAPPTPPEAPPREPVREDPPAPETPPTTR